MKTKLFILSSFGLAISLLTGTVAMADPDATPKVGDTCDRSTFKQFCNGDYIMRCIKGKVKATDCASKNKIDKSYTCAEFPMAEKVDCINDSDLCSTENEKISREKTNPRGMEYTEFYRCEKTAKGQLYYRKISSDRRDFKFTIKGTDKEIHAGLACEKVGEILEAVQKTKEGKEINQKFECKEMKSGKLIYLFHRSSKNKRPHDEQIEIPSDASLPLPF